MKALNHIIQKGKEGGERSEMPNAAAMREATGTRHELYKHSRTRWEQQTQRRLHRQGGQGGRKPKLAAATLPQPHVREQRTMCGRAGVKK